MPDASGIEKDYYEIVDEAFESDGERLINNGRPEHAAYLIRKFFERAQSRVLMFSGHLTRAVGTIPVFESSEIVDAARRFLLRPGSELHIVLGGEIDVDDGDEPKDHPLIAGVQEEYDWGFFRGRMTLSQADSQDSPFQHFLVMDDEACRIETDSERIKAVVAFRHRELCESAADMFDRIKGRSAPLLTIP